VRRGLHAALVFSILQSHELQLIVVLFSTTSCLQEGQKSPHGHGRSSWQVVQNPFSVLACS